MTMTICGKESAMNYYAYLKTIRANTAQDAAEFREEEHPRDKGRFTEKPETAAKRDEMDVLQKGGGDVSDEEYEAAVDKAISTHDWNGVYELVDRAAKARGFSVHDPKVLMSAEDKERARDKASRFAEYEDDEDRESADAAIEEGIEFTDSLPDRMLVFRAVSAKSEGDVRTGEWAGECWAIDAPTAANFGGHNGSNFIICGEVDKKDCDLAEMASLFAQNSSFGEDDSEFEVRVDGEFVDGQHVIPISQVRGYRRPYSAMRYYEKDGILKCGDAATYDDSGRLIPLSRRFNSASKSLRE